MSSESVEAQIQQRAASITLIGESIPLSLFWTAAPDEKAGIMSIVKQIGIKPAYKAGDPFVSLEDVQDIRAYLNALSRGVEPEKVLSFLVEGRESSPRPRAIDTSIQTDLRDFIAEFPCLDEEDFDIPEAARKHDAVVQAYNDGTPIPDQIAQEILAASGLVAPAQVAAPKAAFVDRMKDLVFLAENAILSRRTELKTLLDAEPVHERTYYGRFKVTIAGKQGRSKLWLVELV